MADPHVGIGASVTVAARPVSSGGNDVSDLLSRWVTGEGGRVCLVER